MGFNILICDDSALARKMARSNLPDGFALTSKSFWYFFEHRRNSVGKLVWRDVGVVRRRRALEPHAQYGRTVFQERLRRPVHAVHEPTVGAQNDGIAQIRIPHETEMLDNPAAGRRDSRACEPVILVQLPDGFQRRLPRLDACGETYQTMHVPGIKSVRARSEVVLFSHNDVLGR